MVAVGLRPSSLGVPGKAKHLRLVRAVASSLRSLSLNTRTCACHDFDPHLFERKCAKLLYEVCVCVRECVCVCLAVVNV